VQLPLPAHLRAREAIEAIDHRKNVDGLHHHNVGLLSLHDAQLIGRAGAQSPPYSSHVNLLCTPLGVLHMIDHVVADQRGVPPHARADFAADLAGWVVVVIGQSNIVGKPMAMMLQGRNATVVKCHEHTEGLQDIVMKADLVITAVGQPEFVQGEWLKPGAILVDVGINAVPLPQPVDGNGVGDARAHGEYRMLGYVHFPSCERVGSAISPVPGGVRNTMRAFSFFFVTCAARRRGADDHRAAPVQHCPVRLLPRSVAPARLVG